MYLALSKEGKKDSLCRKRQEVLLHARMALRLPSITHFFENTLLLPEGLRIYILFLGCMTIYLFIVDNTPSFYTTSTPLSFLFHPKIYRYPITPPLFIHVTSPHGSSQYKSIILGHFFFLNIVRTMLGSCLETIFLFFFVYFSLFYFIFYFLVLLLTQVRGSLPLQANSLRLSN